MSRVITLDKGSKRRLDQIRWKLVELFSLLLLALLIFTMSLLVMWWELQRIRPHQDPPKEPQIKSAEPADL